MPSSPFRDVAKRSLVPGLRWQHGSDTFSRNFAKQLQPTLPKFLEIRRHTTALLPKLEI